MIKQEIERCLEGLATCKTTDVMNFDYAGTLTYIKRLKSENVALRNEADENAALSMENKMRADRLEKENAALRERLEKAVELPVKVGDTVWLVGYIHVSADAHLQCVEAKIIDLMMMKDLVRYGAQEGDWCHDFTNADIGRWVFMTREAAEAKIAEEEKVNEETDKS